MPLKETPFETAAIFSFYYLQRNNTQTVSFCLTTSLGCSRFVGSHFIHYVLAVLSNFEVFDYFVRF